MSPLGSLPQAVTLLADVNHPRSQEDVVSNWQPAQFAGGCDLWPHGRLLLPLQTLLSLSLHNTGFSWFSFCLTRLLLLFFTFSPFSTHPRKPGFLGAQTLSFIIPLGLGLSPRPEASLKSREHKSPQRNSGGVVVMSNCTEPSPRSLWGPAPFLAQTLPAYQGCCTPWCRLQAQSPRDRRGSSGLYAGTGSPDTWCRSCG